jgi:hypothetical protein
MKSRTPFSTFRFLALGAGLALAIAEAGAQESPTVQELSTDPPF